MKFFLKNSAGLWDQVSEYVFKNRKLAVNDDGTRKYPDGSPSVICNGVRVQMCGEVTPTEFGWISRAIGAVIPPGAVFNTGTRGFLAEPETVRFKRGNSVTLHNVKTGETWRKA